MDNKNKRIAKIWTKHTIENLEDMIEDYTYTNEELKALKTTISILERQLKNK